MSDQYTGEIRIFPFGYAPEGWLHCDGGLFQVSRYPQLATILGMQYGGDGKNTCAVPDLRGLVVAGAVNNKNNDKYGASTVTLVDANISAHGHMAQAVTTLPSSSSPSGNIPAKFKDRGNMSFNVGVDTKLADSTVSPVGEDGSHNNMQPYLGLAFYIAANGNWPFRPSRPSGSGSESP